MIDKIPQELIDLMVYLNNKSIKTHIVGGAVRDLIYGIEPSDWDLTTPATPDKIIKLLERARKYKCIPTGIAHGTVTILVPSGTKYEITTYRKDVETDGRHAKIKFVKTLNEDLARRDFTINAMALDLKGNLYDPYNGKKDLADRYIRTIGDPSIRFKEDWLRMMRACRFAAYGKGMLLTQDVFKAIKVHTKEINNISIERIRNEIIKLMKYQYPSKGFNAMKNTGLLSEVLPELQECWKVIQNKYHVDDVYTHILKVVDAVPIKRVILRFSALFHDIAKPDTRQVKKDGYVSFYNHEVVGATKAYKAMKRLKFPNSWCTQVVLLVRHHMWRFTDDTKDSTIKKWAAQVYPHSRDLIRLRMADRRGNRAKEGRPVITYAMKKLLRKLVKFEHVGVPVMKKDLAIDGTTLLNLGLKSGPKFKKILDECLEIVLENEATNNKQFLLGFIKGRFRL